MANMLLIETATDICSIGLAVEDKLIDLKENKKGRTHAADAAQFVHELLDKHSLVAKSLDFVVVSSGPGSYTGLRIGVSLAKGLCYGSNLNLVAISTLQSMAYGVAQFFESESEYLLCPMIDARRMEVYCSIYDSKLNVVEEEKALVINETSFVDYLNNKKVVFFGTGSEKVSEIIKHKNAQFINNFEISSSSLLKPALARIKEKNFEDLAYFEPYYLKEFFTTTPKKNLLGL